jgi:hypothetical protein
MTKNIATLVNRVTDLEKLYKLILGALSLIQMVSLSRVNMKEIIVEPQFPLLAMLMAMVLMI